MASYVIGPSHHDAEAAQRKNDIQDGGGGQHVEDTCESEAPCWDPNSSSSRPAGNSQNSAIYYKPAILEVVSKKINFIGVAQLLTCLIVNTNFSTVWVFNHYVHIVGKEGAADEAVLNK